MKNLLLIISLSLSISFISAQTTFEKSIGSNNFDSGVSTIQTSGGQIFTLSNTNKFATPDIALVKMNSKGDTLWSKIIGGAGIDSCSMIQQASANEFLIVGTTNTYGSGDDDLFLVKTDSNGVILFSKVYYGGTGREAGLSVQSSTDNGYLIAGYTESFGSGMKDLFILNVDFNGNVNWNKTYGGLNDDIANSVKRTSDGGYIITGTTNSFNANGDDVYLIKIDINGNKLWSKVIGGANQDIGNSVVQCTDGGYMIAGSSVSFGAGDTDIYIIKTDSNGNLLFSNTINSSAADCASSVKQTSDGEYILTGGTTTTSGNPNVCLMKFNNTGAITFIKKFGGLDDDKGVDVFQTTDGGYFITGTTNTFGAGGNDSYFIKTNSDGTTSCAVKAISVSNTAAASFCNSPLDVVAPSGAVVDDLSLIILGGGYTVFTPCYFEEAGVTNTFVSENNYDDNFESYTIYAVRSTDMNNTDYSNDFGLNVFPNPSNGKEINLSINSAKGEEIIVVVYDALGREHYSKVLIAEKEIEYLFALDLNEKLNSGIYFIMASSQKGCDTKKLIVK